MIYISNVQETIFILHKKTYTRKMYIYIQYTRSIIISSIIVFHYIIFHTFYIIHNQLGNNNNRLVVLEGIIMDSVTVIQRDNEAVLVWRVELV